jgi:hypothetical protein
MIVYNQSLIEENLFQNDSKWELHYLWPEKLQQDTLYVSLHAIDPVLTFHLH